MAYDLRCGLSCLSTFMAFTKCSLCEEDEEVSRGGRTWAMGDMTGIA